MAGANTSGERRIVPFESAKEAVLAARQRSYESRRLTANQARTLKLDELNTLIVEAYPSKNLSLIRRESRGSSYQEFHLWFDANDEAWHFQTTDATYIDGGNHSSLVKTVSADGVSGDVIALAHAYGSVSGREYSLPLEPINDQGCQISALVDAEIGAAIAIAQFAE